MFLRQRVSCDTDRRFLSKNRPWRLCVAKHSMITIVDYHLNNLRSIENTFVRLGHEVRVTSDADDVRTADMLVLPGVGAFPDAMRNLNNLGLVNPIIERVRSGTPILGICLGMHLLLDESDEFGSNPGLGLISGGARKLPGGVHVPHMGWNQIQPKGKSALLAGIPEGSFVYFVHSYYAAPLDPEVIVASTDYGIEFPSVLGSENVWATQFHPEKSQRIGEQILENFARL